MFIKFNNVQKHVFYLFRYFLYGYLFDIVSYIFQFIMFIMTYEY